MNARIFSIGSVALAAIAGLTISASKADALTVNLRFVDVDEIGFDPETDTVLFKEELVGTGTFSFDGGTLADGTYVISSLQNFNFFIQFGNDTFNNSNLVASLDNSFIVLRNSSFGQSIDFLDTERDSIDFFNPNNSSEIFLNLFKDTFATFVNTEESERTLSFRGFVTAEAQVPTPALLPGLIGMGIGVLRQRRAEQKA